MKLTPTVLIVGLLMAAGCHPGPVIGGADSKAAVANGTVAGIVLTEAKAPIVGRKVTAMNTSTSQRFDATTGANGGYTIQVPPGTYRIQVELAEGEKIVKQPGETRINRSDLDPGRDFVIAVPR